MKEEEEIKKEERKYQHEEMIELEINEEMKQIPEVGETKKIPNREKKLKKKIKKFKHKLATKRKLQLEQDQKKKKEE